MAHILLIDDEEDIRLLVSTLLTRLGHQVRQAGNGVEGLKLYRAQPADLVITDVVMPEQEGLSMIIELRKMNPAARIIAMSGGFAHDPSLYLSMAQKFGADRVLRKPFSLEELQEAVRALLSPPADPTRAG